MQVRQEISATFSLMGLENSFTLKTCSETRKDQFEYAKVIKISQNEIMGKGFGKSIKHYYFTFDYVIFKVKSACAKAIINRK